MNIQTIDDINEGSGLLHDATITTKEISFNKEQRTFRAIFNRHKWEESKRRGFLRKMKMQAVHSKLSFEDVKSMVIDDYKSPYPTFEVNFIEVSDLNVNIVFHNDIAIRLVLESYNGKLEDLDEPWDIEGPASLSFGKD